MVAWNMFYLFIIIMLSETKKLINKGTYLCFIDLLIALNTNLLWYKLQLYGLNGPLLNNISGLYKNVQYCVEVNNHLFNYFQGLNKDALIFITHSI